VSIRTWLRGPVVAVPTPFHDDYSLDLDGLGANLREIVGRGVTRGDGVLLVAGAAGEFPALSREERIAVMRASVAAARGTPVATSIQHTDWRETLALARAAADEGVEVAQLGVPYYYNATADDLVRLVEAVGDASPIPLMIYSTWWEGGLDMDPPLLRRLAELENVQALKWSAPGYDRFTEGLAAVADRLAVIDNQAMHVWGHVLGTSTREDYMRGVIVHVEHLERANQDRSSIESYRIPAVLNVAKVRMHVGPRAPVTSFIGRPLFDSGRFHLDLWKVVQTMAAAASAMFQQGVAECKFAMERMTASQIIEFMRCLRSNVLRNPRTQYLSAAFNLNTVAGEIKDADPAIRNRRNSGH